MVTIMIGDTDFSPCLVKGSYKVNEKREVHPWTDANYTKHNDLLRTRVVGSFSVKPLTEEYYDAFIDALGENTDADNVTTITLFVNNTGETKTIRAHVTEEYSVKYADADRMWFDAAKYSVEEI